MVIAFVPASIMSEEGEDKIGDQLYPTVQDALTADESGQTAELVKDVTASTGYQVPSGVVADPVVTIDGSLTSTGTATPVYVDTDEVYVDAETVVKVGPQMLSGMVYPDSELSFDENGNLVVIEPETPLEPRALAYVGHKDKNCVSVITCEEEKCEGWTWNNELEVWECVIDS